MPMIAIKTISDALINQIKLCTGLDQSRVRSYSGSVDEFARETCRVPFCGVVLEGIHWEKDDESVDSSCVDEHYTFKLTIIASDYRSQKFSIEDAYPLIGAIVAKVTGLNLSLSGLSPWGPLEMTKHESLEAAGITVYLLTITAWQTRD